MGINSSNNKVSLDQKLLCLETKVVKPCSYHKKESTMYCAMPTCQKCPYICAECLKDNIHQHQDGIYNHNDFIRAIVTLIENKKTEPNQILQTPVQTNPDSTAAYRQANKLMEQVDALERQIIAMIAQYRAQLQSNIERLAKKNDQEYITKSSSYINFYSNPNILVCKLSSEANDKFLLNLKGQLRSNKRRISTSSEQETTLRLKSEFGSLKSKIRDILNVTNLAGFARKPTLSYSSINPVLKKTFIVSNDSPIKMALAGQTVNVCTQKQLYNVELLTKQVKKMWKQPISILSSRRKGEQFIGVINQSNQSKLIIFDGKNISQISLISKVSSVSILKSKRRLYGILGEQQGIVNMIDLQQNRSIFHYRCSDQPLTHIQICQQNSTICCSSKKSPLHMFRYKSKINDENNDIQFEYILQMNPSILPQGQLQLMRINGTQLYLFGSYRNIVIFDLMLNTQILRTQYKKPCGNFIQAEFVGLGDGECMVSVNEGEAEANVWLFDKIKRSLRVQSIVKDKNQRPILSIAGWKREFWVVREGQKNVDVFYFEE